MNGASLSDLLIEWQLVSKKDMDTALLESSMRKLPIGLVLTMNDLIDAEILHSAIAAQSFMRDRLITPEQTMQAMALVRRKRVSFGLALDLLGIESTSKPRNRLGDLLIESDAIERDLMKSRLTLAKASNLPIGRVLVTVKDVQNDLIDLALNLQVRLRMGELDRDEAVDRLYSARRCIEVITNVSQGSVHQRTRLGQLLIAAGLIEEQTIERALGLSAERGEKLGETLKAMNLVRKEVVDATLAAQRLIREGTLTFEVAINELKSLRKSTQEEARHRERVDNAISFYCFLKLAHILPGSQPDLTPLEKQRRRYAIESQLEDTWQDLKQVFPTTLTPSDRLPEDVRELLNRCGFLTDQQLVSAQRAGRTYKLFREKRLSLEEALIQFHYQQMEAADPGQWTGTFPSLPAI